MREFHVHLAVFNINLYSKERALHEFCFRKQEINRTCGVTAWTTGRTNRNRYGCDPITACCLLLQRLSSAVNQYDLEPVLGMRYSHLSEVLWEVLKKFFESAARMIIDGTNI